MVDRNRLMEELRRMKQLINSDPKVLAKFDLDGNGVIDGEEWEQVRQLVVQRLQREQDQAHESARLSVAANETADQAAVAVGEVAQSIFEEEMPVLVGTVVTGATLGECDELILEQQGGLAQLAEGTLRRNYSILNRDGTILGEVAQQESELLQKLMNTSIFEVPDLHFMVTTTNGEWITFRREQGLATNRIEVTSGSSAIALVSWQFSLLKRTYKVTSMMERGSLTLKGKLLKPFTMEVRNDIGELIGHVQRSWSGLGGFLTGGNRMRISVEPNRLTPNQRWGLLAAALLDDLGAERKG